DLAGFAGGESAIVAAQDDAPGALGLTGDAVSRAVLRVGHVAARSGTTVLDQEPLGTGVLIFGAAPLVVGSPQRGAAVVGVIVRSDLKGRLEQIDAADRAYAEFRAERR